MSYRDEVLTPPTAEACDVFRVFLRDNPDADMRAVPNEWVKRERAIGAEAVDNLEAELATLRAENERLRERVLVLEGALVGCVDSHSGTIGDILARKEATRLLDHNALDADVPETKPDSYMDGGEVDRLAREIDVALCSEDAAKQARLCDLVHVARMKSEELEQLRGALVECVEIMGRNIYPKPDVSPDHPFAVLERARKLVKNAKP